MAKHTFTDADGDVFSAEVDPELPTLMDIMMNDSEHSHILIRVDGAEGLAGIILAAAKEGES
jgi:hypothetical protein